MLTSYFATPAHQAERRDLPLLRALAARYADERPFAGATVVMGHLLVRNTLAVAEALFAGGAQLVLAEGHISPAAAPVIAELETHGVSVLPNAQAVARGDLFVDVSCILGRLRTPAGAAEVTRTGVLHYEKLGCPVVSADDCRAKRIEGFYGTGDGFLRAWRQLRPHDPPEGKRVVQFGYGKIGRGVAHRCRAAGLEVTVADVSAHARRRAREDGFEALAAEASPDLQRALKAAHIVISVTSLPGVMSRGPIPPDWLRAGGAALVNLGAEDEFGTAFEDAEILGGRGLPLNFHLANPTRNRYVDAPLAAHALALEALVRGAYPPGVHPLPEAMDRWLVAEWRRAWPDEDLAGIGPELGLA
jgi:adenosylhomocysteinase